MTGEFGCLLSIRIAIHNKTLLLYDSNMQTARAKRRLDCTFQSWKEEIDTKDVDVAPSYTAMKRNKDKYSFWYLTVPYLFHCVDRYFRCKIRHRTRW